MRTTIDLPDSLFREVKTRAVQERVKLKDLVASYIAAGLKGDLSSPEKATRSPLPVFRKPTDSKIPALSNSEIDSMLNEENIPSDPSSKY